MRNGFTLVELLAVIIILGVVAILAIPRIQEALYSSQDEAYDLTVTRLENIAFDYVYDNNLESQITNNTPLDIYLSELYDDGYVEQKDLVDPRNKNRYIDKDTSYVHFTLVDGNIEYDSYFTLVSY